MFQIPVTMISYWNNHPEAKAAVADIMQMEARLGVKLPRPYVEFITEYGFVVFGRDEEERHHFDYAIVFPDRKEIHEGNISFLEEPNKLLEGYEILTSAEDEGDEEFPKFPKNYLPVGNDAGQGQILLELGGQAGRVWYWPYREWAWGTEDNTWLGFVAEEFYGFINGLRP